LFRKLRLLLFLLLAAVTGAHAQNPVASITATPISGCPPLGVSFVGSATGTGPFTWSWNFGGVPPNVSKATSTSQNTAVIFNTPGTYNVTLIVKNASGSSLPVTKQITVNPIPVADFKQDTTSGCFPTTIHFTNTSTPLASIVSYTWDYGDGTQDFNIQNPSHTYHSGGSFGVTLYVTNNFGCTGSAQIKNVQKAITLSGGVIPNFTSALNSSCTLPVTATFTNASSGPPLMSYSWDFGDGMGFSDNTFSPTHSYTTAGTYNVKLAATSSQGCTDTLPTIVNISASGNLSDFTGSGTVCINTPINFTNISSPNPNSATWDYGDGSPIDPVRNGLHTYTTLGIHHVTLVNTFSGCTGTVTKDVNVVGPPTTNFTATNVNACQPPLTANFTDQSTGATSWLWNFGDGTPTSTVQNPQHLYTSYGSYQVILTASSASGCSNVLAKNSFINIVKPAVSIVNLPAYGCAPYTYTAAAAYTVVDGIATYKWDFGNGFIFNGQTPPPQIYAAGVYTVTLTITTNGGCTATTSGQVKVGSVKPVPAFTFVPPTACIKSPIVFTDGSTGGANQWSWNFGDGSVATGPSPTYSYLKPGTFKVLLTAYNNGCFDTISHFITINPPLADFNSISTCGARSNFTFIDNSTGATGWNWDFGDGTTSAIQNPPVHVYPPGPPTTYNVTLKVSNSTFGCTDIITKQVTTNQTTVVSAAANPTCVGAPVGFTTVSPPNVVSFAFDFGDGTGIFPSTGAIVHTYTAPGTYTVKVQTTDNSGCVEMAPSYLMNIGGPTVKFTSPPAISCGQLNASFTNQSTPNGSPIKTYAWDFGDGSTSNLPSPTHNYIFQGNFLVKLKVTDNLGCSDSLISPNVITVSIPNAKFNTSEDSSCPNAPNPIRFNNTSSGGFNPVYSWDFGDASPISNAISPVYAYTAVGNYQAKLSMTDTYGCTSSFSNPVLIIVGIPVASFTMSGNYSACPPFNDHFTFTGSFARSYSWDFNTPGGAFSQLQNPSYLYADPGDYDPFVKITSPGGCIANAPPQHVHVDGPIGLFSYTPFTGCNFLDVNFKVTTSNVVSFTWNFGDGSAPVTTSTPTITYHYRPGGFTPFVVLEDALGCKVTKLGTDDIIVDTIENVAFTAVKSILCDSGTVNFSDISALGDRTVISNYIWDFNDGSPTQSGLLPNTSHFYSSVNNYNPILTIQTAGGCSSSTSVPIIVAASPQISINGMISQCEPAVLTFTGIQGAPDPYGPLTWSWNFGNGQTSNVQNPTPVSYPKAGEYVVSLTAANTKGCSTMTDTSAANHLFIYPIPNINAGADITICDTSQLQLNATGASLYTWLPPVNGNLSCLVCQNPIATSPVSTYFIVQGTSLNGCTAKDTIQVTVNTQVTVNATGSDSVCLGQSAQLNATGAAIYNWTPAQGLNNPNIANPVSTPDASQIGNAASNVITYSVTGYDNIKCYSDTKSVNITAFNNPVISLVPNATINVGSSYQINSSVTTNITSLNWTPSGTLSCSNCLTPLATPMKTIRYVLTAINEGGCATSDSIRVQVICDGANFFVPNTFSPNGDGVNDYFIINGVGLNVIPSITIYNRWGQIVFQKSNFAPNSSAAAWDGTFNGQPAPSDVYIYTIQILCNNATLIPYHGNVTLIR
jgi:gliding motility-associated-like protein